MVMFEPAGTDDVFHGAEYPELSWLRSRKKV